MTVGDNAATPVEIRPGIGTLAMFKFMDYNTWHAIAEFVDNSVASWQQNKERLRVADGPVPLVVSIKFDPTDSGVLRVWDNAAGISSKDYSRAFKPAERPPDQTSLSRYGMGMKTAACWFSDHWRVTSTALGEATERTVEFDIPNLIQRGQDAVTPTTRAAKAKDHWTELVLWDLNQMPQGRSVGKIKDYLSQMYRRFLVSGDVEIYWNDERLKYKDRQVLVAPYFKNADSVGAKRLSWQKSLEFKLPRGELVRGRAMLFEKGEQSAAGLHLFWRGRMIKGNLEDFYRPQEIFAFAGSYRVQRLLVELDLDELTPTVDKKDFVWGRASSSEQQLLAALKKELNRAPLRLLEQADHYRSSKVDKGVKEAAGKAASGAAQAVEERGSEELTRQAERAVTDEGSLPKPNLLAGSAARDVMLTVKVRDDIWNITIQLSDRAEDRNQWLEITERPRASGSGARNLGIKLSLSNPFTLRYATDSRSVTLLVRLAAGIALAEISAREAGGKNVGVIRRNLNELLLTVLSDSDSHS